MNKKRKILTLIALAVFGAIIALHYIPVYEHSYRKEETRIASNIDEFLNSPANAQEFLNNPANAPKRQTVWVLVPGGFRLPPLIHDARMPLFALAVFYAGLFAILGDNKRKEQ